MVERILFEDERHIDRSVAAEYLHTVADRLADEGSVTLERGGDEITVDVPSNVEFEVKVEREGPEDGPGEIGFELELEWPENASDGSTDDGLSVR